MYVCCTLCATGMGARWYGADTGTSLEEVSAGPTRERVRHHDLMAMHPDRRIVHRRGPHGRAGPTYACAVNSRTSLAVAAKTERTSEGCPLLPTGLSLLQRFPR